MNIRSLEIDKHVLNARKGEVAVGCGSCLCALAALTLIVGLGFALQLLIQRPKDVDDPVAAGIAGIVCSIVIPTIYALIGVLLIRRKIKVYRRAKNLWRKFLAKVDEEVEAGNPASSVVKELWHNYVSCSFPVPPTKMETIPGMCCQCARDWKSNWTETNNWEVKYGSGLEAAIGELAIGAATGLGVKIKTKIQIPLCDSCALYFPIEDEIALPPLQMELKQASRNKKNRVRLHRVHREFVEEWNRQNPNAGIQKDELNYSA